MTPATNYRLKTSGGILSAVSLALAHTTTFVSSEASWRGDFLWAVQQLGSGLYLVVPVILALACAPAVLPGGAPTEQALLPVFVTRARMRRFIADVTPLLLCHLGFVSLALGVTVSNGTSLNSSAWVTVVVQMLTIGLAVALGRAIGEVVDHLGAVVMAASLGTVLLIYGEGLIRVSAGNSPYAGLHLDLGPYAVAGAAMVVFLLAILLGPGGIRARSTVLTAVTVVAIALGIQLDEPTLTSTGEQPSRCSQVRRVSVCVYAGYEFMLPELEQQAAAALTAFASEHVDTHVETIAQTSPGLVESPGTISVLIDQASLQNGVLNPFAVSSSLIHPAWCPRLRDLRPLPMAFDLAQIRTFAWLQRSMGVITEADYALEVPEFAALTERQQRDSVQEFLDANRECDGLK